MAGRSMVGLDDFTPDIYDKAVNFELERNGVDFSTLKRGHHGDIQRRLQFHSSSNPPVTFWIYSGIPDLAVPERRAQLRSRVDQAMAKLKQAIEQAAQVTAWDPIMLLGRERGAVVKGFRMTTHGGQGVRRMLGLLQAVSASCLPHTTLVIVVPALKSTPLYLRNGSWVANKKATRTHMAIPTWGLLDTDTSGQLPEEILPLLIRLGGYEVLSENTELPSALAPVHCSCCWAEGATLSRCRRSGRRWGQVQHSWSFIPLSTVAEERMGRVVEELAPLLAPHGGLALIGHGADELETVV